MNLSELIRRYGDDEVAIQKLDDSATSLNMSNGVTKITFLTEEPSDIGGTDRLGLIVWMERDRVQAIIDEAKANPPPQPNLVGEIVPPHCSGSALAFETGVFHVNKNGSGYIAINEEDFVLEDDRCEGPDGPEGSVHWIARMDASEIIALRDFLNGNTTADRLADKIEDLIAEFGDDPKAALECVSEHLQLRRHARSVSREVIDG